MAELTNDREYITVGELSVGFSEHIIVPTYEFVGKNLTLNFDGPKSMVLSFLTNEALSCEITEHGISEKYISSYLAIEPRKNLYFIDFIVSFGNAKSVSVILDKTKGFATVITGLLPDEKAINIPIIKSAEAGEALTKVQVQFEHAAVNTPFTLDTGKHETTDELIGQRVQFVYSSKDAYEHIYLNEKFYSWHCIAGKEKGLCDTDRCFYYKLDENLYCFVWLEKIIPTIGIVIEDFDVHRSYGKICGYEDYLPGKINNFPVGSYATPLNNTSYDYSRLS